MSPLTLFWSLIILIIDPIDAQEQIKKTHALACVQDIFQTQKSNFNKYYVFRSLST